MNERTRSAHTPRTVFLDTQVFVQQNFQYDKGLLEAFRQHVNAGRFRHLTTDVTIQEMRSNVSKSLDSARVALRRFQTDARVLRNLPSPSIARLFRTWNRRKVLRDLLRQLDSFLDGVDTTILSTDAVSPSAVFERYFAKAPPFSDPKKQGEFPDAFAMEALLKYTNEYRCRITVVSDDRDWKAFANAEQNVDIVERLEELLQLIQEDSPLVALASRTLAALEPEIKAAIAAESRGLGFFVVDWPAAVINVGIHFIQLSHTYIANVTEDSILFSADASVSFRVDVEYAEPPPPDRPRPWDVSDYRIRRHFHDPDYGPLWTSESFRVLGTVLWSPDTPEEGTLAEITIVDPRPVPVPVYDYESS